MNIPGIERLRKALQSRLWLATAVTVISFFVMACPSAMQAQIDTGSISGTVADSQGAVIPNATIEITNVETGYSDSQQTTQTGSFDFPTVKIGNYVITVRLPVSSSGFSSRCLSRFSRRWFSISNCWSQP